MKQLDKFKQQSVLVVGDMMLDKYIIGSVERISPEAPVPVLKLSEVRQMLGGAGNVVQNVNSLGAKVYAMGRVGDDESGHFFVSALKDRGIDGSFIFFEGSTIVKTRVSASNQQFIRIDEEKIIPPSERIINEIKDGIDQLLDKINIIIISDYAKGFISEELCQIVINAAKNHGVPVIVDPKGKSAAKYYGAAAITPNNKEFAEFTGIASISDEEEIKTAAQRLCKENLLERVIFTRSEKGISVIDADGNKTDYPALKKEVVDVTGAGDTVVSVIALGMSSGMSLDKTIRLANIAASIVISRFGASQTTIAELRDAIGRADDKTESEETAVERVKALKQRGKKIVFTNGCFDLVHAGHISSFKQAKELGDVLVVGINSDDSIRRIKGKNRPIVDLKNRVCLLSAIEYVDYVIPFNEDTPQTLIEKLNPDVLVKGKDWQGKTVAGAEFVLAHGGKVEFIDLEQGLSTTNIIEKIKETFM